MDIAEQTTISVAGERRALDLRKKVSRLLAESAALHSVASDEIVENLPGVGDIQD